MSPRGSSRVISCTPTEARARREQAEAFIDVAEMVLSEPADQTHSHVAAALAVLAAIAATDGICSLRLGRYNRSSPRTWCVKASPPDPRAQGSLATASVVLGLDPDEERTAVLN